MTQSLSEDVPVVEEIVPESHISQLDAKPMKCVENKNLSTISNSTEKIIWTKIERASKSLNEIDDIVTCKEYIGKSNYLLKISPLDGTFW